MLQHQPVKRLRRQRTTFKSEREEHEEDFDLHGPWQSRLCLPAARVEGSPPTMKGDRLAYQGDDKVLDGKWEGACLMKSRTLGAAIAAACTTLLAGCVITSMQGYADLDRPARPV